MNEPQSISEILPGVMKNIRKRSNCYRAEHNLHLLGQRSEQRKEKVLSALRDFMRSNRTRKRSRQKSLWKK